jgi:hypothetical protein
MAIVAGIHFSKHRYSDVPTFTWPYRPKNKSYVLSLPPLCGRRPNGSGLFDARPPQEWNPQRERRKNDLAAQLLLLSVVNLKKSITHLVPQS